MKVNRAQSNGHTMQMMILRMKTMKDPVMHGLDLYQLMPLQSKNEKVLFYGPILAKLNHVHIYLFIYLCILLPALNSSWIRKIVFGKFTKCWMLRKELYASWCGYTYRGYENWFHCNSQRRWTLEVLEKNGRWHWICETLSKSFVYVVSLIWLLLIYWMNLLKSIDQWLFILVSLQKQLNR